MTDMLIYNAVPNDAWTDLKKYRTYNLSWTTEPPKESGWYWAKQSDEDEPEIVKIFNDSVMMIPYNAWLDMSSYSHWLGPLPVPELPNTKK